MGPIRRWGIRSLLLLGGGALLSFFTWVPVYVDASRNQAPQEPSRRGRPTFPLADLHADTLLWARDPAKRQARGAVDLPRLREGGVALQVFSVVSKVPLGIHLRGNPDSSRDLVTPLAIAQLWPPGTWFDPYQRALYQARRLRTLADQSDNQLTLIGSGTDLRTFMAQRAQNPKRIAAVLSLEGTYGVNGDLSRVDALIDAGFRMMAPAHFLDTEVSGSAHGEHAGGLTEFGRRWITHLESHRVIIDLAHASAATIDDTLALAQRPVIVSHTGLQGICESPRNLTDAQVKAIAAKGGLIGVGFWSVAVCGDAVDAIARSIAYGVKLVGAEHIALGSDFDGFVATPLAADRLGELAPALAHEGLTPAQVAAVLGGSALRFLSQNL